MNGRNEKTIELEERVKRVLVRLDPRMLEFCSVKFQIIHERCNSGTYACEMNGQYYFAHSERGQIYDVKTTKCEQQIDFWCLECYIKDLLFFNGNEFLTTYTREEKFDKELEIFSRISDEMYQRKKQEIDRILFVAPNGHNFTTEELFERCREYDAKHGISSCEEMSTDSQKEDSEKQKANKILPSARLRAYLKRK